MKIVGEPICSWYTTWPANATTNIASELPNEVSVLRACRIYVPGGSAVSVPLRNILLQNLAPEKPRA